VLRLELLLRPRLRLRERAKGGGVWATFRAALAAARTAAGSLLLLLLLPVLSLLSAAAAAAVVKRLSAFRRCAEDRNKCLREVKHLLYLSKCFIISYEPVHTIFAPL
jgi:hypothetical protein